MKIGTCVRGEDIITKLPEIVKAGFETVEFYFNDTLGGLDLQELSKRVEDILADSEVEVSGIGLYCNPLVGEQQQKELRDCIQYAHLFHTDFVGTFAGALPGKTVFEALPVFKDVFTDLTNHAKDHGVRIGIENAHMYGHWYNTTCNIGFCPKAWEMMFDAVDNDALGLEWEPSHQLEQLIDPIKQLEDWLPKIYHVHGKDGQIDWNMVKTYGIWFGSDYCVHRFPGLGDSDWSLIIKKLQEGGYKGDIAIEGFHDPVYNGEREYEGQRLALAYLKECRANV